MVLVPKQVLRENTHQSGKRSRKLWTVRSKWTVPSQITFRPLKARHQDQWTSPFDIPSNRMPLIRMQPEHSNTINIETHRRNSQLPDALWWLMVKSSLFQDLVKTSTSLKNWALQQNQLLEKVPNQPQLINSKCRLSPTWIRHAWGHRQNS